LARWTTFSSQLPDIPDFPDRIIAATAKFYSVPVLSRDSRIKSSTIQTVW
jgi:PIN domain nuclease of toxin-antitoxin system